MGTRGLSRGEIEGRREDFVDRLMAGDTKALQRRRTTHTRENYLAMICAGSYPEPLGRSGRRRNAWFDNYLQRIVSRDARDVSRLSHLDLLPTLIRLLAANNAGELVKARVARDAGIPETSLHSYVDLLETLYLIQQIPAWGNNLTRRVTGRPKVSLLDTGLAARLNNVTPAAMQPGAVSDAAGGLEVDLVLEDSGRRVAGVEVKSARTVTKKEFRGLKFLRDKLGDRFTLGVLLYTGPDALPFGDRLWAIPVSALWS